MPPNINKPLVAPGLWAARGNNAPELDIVAYGPVYLFILVTTTATIYKVIPMVLVQENSILCVCWDASWYTHYVVSVQIRHILCNHSGGVVWWSDIPPGSALLGLCSRQCREHRPERRLWGAGDPCAPLMLERLNGYHTLITDGFVSGSMGLYGMFSQPCCTECNMVVNTRGLPPCRRQYLLTEERLRTACHDIRMTQWVCKSVVDVEPDGSPIRPWQHCFLFFFWELYDAESPMVRKRIGKGPSFSQNMCA